MAALTKKQQAVAAALLLLDENIEGKEYFDRELVTAEVATKFLSFLSKKNKEDIYTKAFKDDYKGIFLTDENALTFQTVVEPFLITDALLFKEVTEARANFTNRAQRVDDDIVAELTELAGDEAVDMAVSDIRSKLRTK